MKKKEAARKVHEYLRDVLHEPDEMDTSAAYKLQDLFDCRVCAGHVMQVYVKGIMEGYTNAEGHLMFGMDDEVSPEEAKTIRQRVLAKEKREPQITAGTFAVAECIMAEEAVRMCAADKAVLLVDVRTQREYENGHLPGAVNVPVLSVMKNPYMVSERRDRRILLYCNEGYQSGAAARYLLEAGFEQVYYFMWKSDKGE